MAFSAQTLVAATAASLATATLNTGEGRQLQKRVAQEVFDDALGMSPGVAQTFSSMTLYMALTAGYNTALNAMIFNPNLQANTDLKQSETGVEGRAQAANEQVSNVKSGNGEPTANTSRQGIGSPADSNSTVSQSNGVNAPTGEETSAVAKKIDALNIDVGETSASGASSVEDPYASAGGQEKWSKYKYLKEQLEAKTRQNPTPWDPPTNRRLGTDIRDAIWLHGVDHGWW